MISSAIGIEPSLPFGFIHYHFDVDNQLQQMIQMSYQHYAESLSQSVIAKGYLASRNISVESIQRFHFGVCNRTLPLKMPKRYSKADKRGQLKTTGIIKPTGHEIFCGSITIPIWINGEIVGGYGRRLSKRVMSDSTPYPFHLIDEEALFNENCLSEHHAVILTKSPFEAISLMQMGFDNVIATISNFEFSDIQIKRLKDHKVKRVKVLVNLSPYYLNHIRVITARLKTFGIQCKIAELPPWQDINHLICHLPDAKTQIARLLHQARTFQEKLDEN